MSTISKLNLIVLGTILITSILFFSFVSYINDTTIDDKIEAEVNTSRQSPTYTDAEFFWRVPNTTETVYIQIFDENDQYKTQYNISRYITIKPRQKLRVITR